MIKALIFDMWGTILENNVYPSPLKQSKKILGQFEMPYHEFVVRFENAFMTTRYNDIKEGLDRVFKEFNVSPDEYNRVEKLTGLWNKSKILSKLYDDTISTLNELKKDYKLILLSNLPCTHADVVERFKFNEIFDEVFLSYEMGKVKANGGYKEILKKIKLKASEVIMIGDSMESDIEGAKDAGIKGILVDRRLKRDFEPKVADLSELPKKIKEL